MQLVVLGANTRTLSILDVLDQAEGDHAVVGWFDSDEVGDLLAQRYPQANRLHSPDDLTNTIADKILVVGQGGDDLEKETLLRDFARDSVPMILDQPACSGIFSVELDMIQRDTLAPLIPFHPPSKHPVISRVAQWTRGRSPVGQIEQVVIERSVVDRSDNAIRSALARDALILRRLLGNFQRVGAMPAKEVTNLANLNVQLTGEATAVGRWSVNPINDPSGAVLSLIGEQGKITLTMPDEGPWTLNSTEDSIAGELLPPVDEAGYANEIKNALASPNVPISPTWEDAFRATDFADTACESVRRGKTLPISNERLTEEDTFKSLMAAGGCLIILVLPLLLLAISLFDGLDIPVQRSMDLELVKGERTIVLPGDFAALTTIKVTTKSNVALSSPSELPSLSRRELFAEFGNNTEGQPAAFNLGRNDITFAPAADDMYGLQMDYEGSFRIWRGWPYLLLVPIVVFLLLQLLKLVFPKPNSPGTES